MATLSIDLYRRELIGKPCRRVERSDDLGYLVAGMSRILCETGMPSLAAPQVGAFVQVVMVRKAELAELGQAPLTARSAANPANPAAFEVLVNPRIVNLGGRDLLETESCLSLPPIDEATARIWRSEFAHVRTGTLENTDADEIRIYKGMRARYVQHEIDHLQGLFFIDRCQPVARGIVLRRFERYLQEQAALSDQLAAAS